MKIMFVSSEVAPFIKTGGLGDVAGALPEALAAAGHDVRVFCPLYSAIGQNWREKMTHLKNAYVQLGWRNQYCGIFYCEKGGVTYYFIDNEYYFARTQLYGEYDDAERFAYFSKAVLEILPDLDWKPDVIHCNDWQTALVPVYYNLMFAGRPDYANIKTVFTIHNIAFQGRYGRDVLEYVFGIDDAHFRSGFMEMDGDVNLMKAAILASGAVTTVSPSYAEEIQTPYYGHGLDSILRNNSYKLHGILNGIDMTAFNPATDPALAKHYTPSRMAGKKEDKADLLSLCGLEGDENTPVIGMIGRLTDQKGLDLVSAIVPQILDGNTQVVVLGTGDKQYEDAFRYYENTNKGTFCACIQYDEARAHRIYAGADALLVPSRFEPCGLTQLNAMHYGTLPIVRETGGLKDTVQPYNEFNGDGNGFTFDRYDAGLLLDAINRAKTLYFNNRYHWDEIVQRDMDKDVSWANSARQYKDLYMELTPW